MMGQIIVRGERERTNALKVSLFNIENKLPLLGKIIYNIWRSFCLIIFILNTRNPVKRYFSEIYWIDPKRIRYTSLKEFDIWWHKGKIIGGDWDKLEKPFDHLDVYVALKERLLEDRDWKDTFYYRMILKGLERGLVLWNCKNESDLNTRLKNLESLFYNIKKNGYKSQSQILSENNVRSPIARTLQNEDEITVNIGRNRDLLFNNGAHRLSIAKLLNLSQIPIKITVIHPEAIDKLKKQ